jgi:threonine dehydrogenase-like Zn-dependent dehydrogenase
MHTTYIDKDVPRILAVKALKRIWPGVIWSPLSHVHTVNLPEPPLPGERWLRVRNQQCGICATDLTLLYAKVDVAVSAAAVPGISRIYLGHEAVGEVVEIGAGVTRYKIGDRVIIEARPFSSPNCHTQAIDPPCRYCAEGNNRLCQNASLGIGPVGVGAGWGDSYTAHESEIWPVPDSLTDDQASLVEPSACALHGVLRRPPRAKEQVLVIGAGIIGLLTIQAAKAVQPDCQLTVLARYPQQIAAARRLGADHVISSGDLYQQVADLTGSHLYRAPLNRGMLLGGFGVIYDCVGSGATVQNALRWAAAQGSVVVVGVSPLMHKLDFSPVYSQEVDLLGSNTFGVENWQDRRVHTFDLVMAMMQDGRINDQGLITHRFPIAELRRAVATATDKRSGAIKVTFSYAV